MAGTKEKQASADASMIAADELSHSYAFFHRICQDDTLDEKETKEFFKKTLLSEEDCAQILQLSDMDQDGRLTVSEFILAVHYIKAKLLGLSLPDAVPQGLKQKVMPFNLPPASDEHIAKCRLALLDHRQLVNENGMLPVDGARSILSRSGLSSSTLYHIWRLSDADKDDLLSFLDFVVAVHLVNLALKGYTLPVSLDHKVVLRSKKIQSPDFTVSSPRVKITHIPWIQSGSLSSPTQGRSPCHFVLPSTPLSPGPGLPTPEHPFMSFSTFARGSPLSPLSKRQEARPELPPRHPPATKKRSYVNLIVGVDGPMDEQDLEGSDTAGQQKKRPSLPPAIPPRQSSLMTTPTQQPSPKPNSTGDKMDAEVPEHERVRPTVSAPIPTPAAHKSHFVTMNDTRSSSPPPPAKLGSIDANREFMKSLEDLTSIGSFVADDTVASAVEGKESMGGSDFTLDMNASLDDLVAALSEMESSLQTLEETNKDPPPQARSDPEKRHISNSANTTDLLEDTNIGNLEDAIQGFIKDASPVEEVEREVRAALQSPQCQQQMVEKQPPPPNTRQSQEYSDLVSSLQSVGSEGEQGIVQGNEDLVSSLRALGGEGNGITEESTDPTAALAGPGGGGQSKPGKQRPPLAPKPSQKPTVGPKSKPNPKNGLGKSKSGTGALIPTRTPVESLIASVK